jgi:hypothetical protein
MTAGRRRRGMLAALLTAAALALSGCAGFATGGPVNAGLAPGDVAPPDFSYVPLKPQNGASPEQIVQGFIDAGNGPQNNWAIAQLYLAPGFRGDWKPSAGVTVDDRSQRSYGTEVDGKLSLTIAPKATVDDTGAYKPSEGGSTTLSFKLAKVGGQWRITDAPNGIVLGADQFASVFHQYSLMYFDPTWRYLVPDVRWFPATNARTRIAQALIEGKPSPWLADSVVSAFPENVSLPLPSVPATNGVAQVELSDGALTQDQTTLNRMQTQLVRSLATAGTTDVAMTYSGTTLPAEPVSTTLTRIDARALVQTDKAFGFLASTGEIEAIPGVSDAMKRITPVSIQLSADYTTAAVRTASGVVARVPAQGDIVALDSRPNLVDPVIDTHGYIWSVPSTSPSTLTAYSPDGKAVSIEGGWSGASSVAAMAISRDGTRLAAILDVGGQPEVAVAGVVRNGDGVPQSIGTLLQLAVLPGKGIDLTWLDEDTLGVLSTSGDDVVEIEQPVGGPGDSTTAQGGAVTISGSSATIVRLRVSNGTLYAQRGSNWEQAATKIRVLATQQGMP